LWRAAEIEHLVAHGLPQGRGLDLGCGDGLLTRVVLEEKGPRDVVGVEPDPAEAAMAQALGIYAAVYVVRGDRVPEPDAAFDWVLSNSVLEHIDDLEPVLREVGRLLRLGGHFVFTVPGPDFHACLRGPRLGGSRDAYLRRLDERLAHRRYWNRAEWTSALERHGMRVESMSEYLTVAEVRRWESISGLTAGLLYSLGRGRRQPIDLQRSLGLRRQGRRMPAAVARSLVPVMTAGLSGSSPIHGCLLVRAAKRASVPTQTAARTG
jgi:SAM-dependent methyltransferase